MPTEDNSIESVVSEAVKAKVQTMMVEALGHPGALVQKIVAEALTQEVQVGDRYASRPQKMTLINKMVKEAIVDEATKVMKEFIFEHKNAIRAELIRNLTTNKKNIAEALIDSLVQTAGSAYTLRLTFNTKDEL